MASNVDLGRLLTLAACLLLGLAACTAEPEKAKRSEPGPLSIAAVSYPLAYFAERLAPKGSVVKLPIPADVDPAHWRPSADAIVAFQDADIILLNGAGYASWTHTASLPKAKSVVTAAGCRDRFLPGAVTGSHRHGPEGEHSHRGTAFTTWLDLGLATCQAAAVRDAIIQARPDEATYVRAQFASLERELSELDSALRKAAEPWVDGPVLASHPVYQYLGDAYGLDIRSFHFEPDQALDDEALVELDSARNERGPSLMLWEAAPLPSTREALGELGIRIVVFDTASKRPTEADFMTVMRANVERLRCAARAEGCK